MDQSIKKERDLLKYFSQNNEALILEIFKSDQNIRIHQFANAKQFTVLHFTCFNNNLCLTQKVVEYCTKSHEISKKELANLINSKNKEGFTPMHLASFKGNLEIIKLLLQNGGDYTLKNVNGLSVLHMSVQGDHVRTSCFWIKMGIQIDQTDNTNQTPLTWAAFLGSVQMVNFLIPWGANINHKTSDKGQTALHIATQQGQTRIVRKLLIKGIDRSIRDKNNKTAYDIALESRFRTIQKMIQNRLGILERCGIRQPYSKIEKQYASVTFFIISALSCIIMTLIFSLPFVYQTGLLITYLIASCILIGSFSLVTISDPGFVELNKTDLLELLENHSVESICPDCQIVKPKRSRHCEICQRCIDQYDHHCPWLSNCVGQKNLITFLVFLFILILLMILQFILQFQVLKQENIQTFLFFSEPTEFLLFWKIITFYYTIILNCLFILPVVGLFFVQFINVIKGQTTYERYMEKKGQNKAQARKNSQETQSRTFKPRKGNLSQETVSTTDDDKQTSDFCGVNRKQKKKQEKLNQPLIKETEFSQQAV